jgi:hypothetical protein
MERSQIRAAVGRPPHGGHLLQFFFKVRLHNSVLIAVSRMPTGAGTPTAGFRFSFQSPAAVGVPANS